METTITCRGCGTRLPSHQAAFAGRPDYNLWAREGYCSFFCFRDNAPPDLLAKDEETEREREEWMETIQSAPQRVEAPRAVEERPVASVAVRLVARVLDTFSVGFVVGLLAGLAYLMLETEGPIHEAGRGGLERAFSGASWLEKSAYALGAIAFFTICHGVAGATPWKLLLGIVVVRENGAPCGMLPALLREVLYVVDVMFLGLIAFACMAAGEDNQRLGDFAARTVVVKMRAKGGRSAYLGRVAGATLAGLLLWLGVVLATSGFSP